MKIISFLNVYCPFLRLTTSIFYSPISFFHSSIYIKHLNSLISKNSIDCFSSNNSLFQQLYNIKSLSKSTLNIRFFSILQCDSIDIPSTTIKNHQEISNSNKKESNTEPKIILKQDETSLKLDEINSFTHLGLSPTLVKYLSSLGISKPSPIQKIVIPALLESKKDSIIHSPTGYGKTFSYLLPVLEKIDPKLPSLQRKVEYLSLDIQCLILVPNSQLCLQIYSLLSSFLSSSSLFLHISIMLPLYYRSKQDQTLDILARPPQILIATPKELSYLFCFLSSPLSNTITSSSSNPTQMDQKAIKSQQKLFYYPIPSEYFPDSPSIVNFLQHLSYFIIDEADIVIKPLGHYSPLKFRKKRYRHPRPTDILIPTILKSQPNCQMLFVSAYINNPIKKVMMKSRGSIISNHYLLLSTNQYHIPLHISHFILPVSNNCDKITYIVDEIKKHQYSTSILFITPHDVANDIAKEIKLLGLRTVILNEELLNIDSYKKFRNLYLSQYDIIITTEYNARGLDLVDVHQVFILSPPQQLSSYLHMCGRVGRNHYKLLSHHRDNQEIDRDKDNIHHADTKGLDKDYQSLTISKPLSLPSDRVYLCLNQLELSQLEKIQSNFKITFQSHHKLDF